VLGGAAGGFEEVGCLNVRTNTPDTIIVDESGSGPRSSPFNDSWVDFSDEDEMQWNSSAGPFNDSWVDFSDSTVFVVSFVSFLLCLYWYFNRWTLLAVMSCLFIIQECFLVYIKETWIWGLVLGKCQMPIQDSFNGLLRHSEPVPVIRGQIPRQFLPLFQ